MSALLLVAVAARQSPCVAGASRSAQVMRRLYDSPYDGLLVAAHRGGWRDAPENSLQAIDYTISMGRDIIEIDIRMTKDRQFAVMHDKTLDRTTTGGGKVSHHTLVEIQQLRITERQRPHDGSRRPVNRGGG